MQIPIQNIYYLLCYAWNKLDESEVVDVKAIDSTELIDLFAKVLSTGLSRLLKQGLDRYYIEHEDAVSGIKGKLNLSETIKQNILPLSKTVCVFDEFDYNVLHNQILKTTIIKLLRTKNLDSILKDETIPTKIIEGSRDRSIGKSDRFKKRVKNATAPALILVGLFMMSPILKIDLNDYTEAVPAFLTILFMVTTYSIANGIMYGALSWILLKLFTKKGKEISVTMVVIAVLLTIKLILG
jgi:hypothetical protein